MEIKHLRPKVDKGRIIRAKLIVFMLNILLLSYLFLNHSGIALVGSLENDQRRLPKVFVYDDDVFFPDLCKTSSGPEKRSYYFDVMNFWLSGLKGYAHRTKQAYNADVFFIPFNVDDSFHAKECRGKSHYDRLLDVIKYLETTSSFQNKHGKDHFWPILGYRMTFRNTSGYFPAGLHNFVYNMTLARYIDWKIHTGGHYYGIDTSKIQNMWRISQCWRCTISSPIATEKDIIQDSIDFEEWSKRSNFLYYRGANRHSSAYGTWKDPNEIRNATEKLISVIPNILIGPHHAENRKSYIRELQNSKFCFVLRGDDPQTSRFYDALSSGCIPVIISDGWGLTVAPFSDTVRFEEFTITIPESVFWYDPVASIRFLYTLSSSRCRKMLDALHKYRQMLLWPLDPAKVVSSAFAQYRVDCMD